jgi:hypothetical protein
MAPLPNSGNPISMQMIFDEFGPYRTNGNGFEIDDYTGTTYWMNDFPYSSGKFTTTKNNLTLADFYGKRATDPVVPGLQRINASTVFTVPPYRNLLNIRVWGGGGGGGSASYKGGEALGTSGSSSSATVRHLGATTVLTSQGGVRGRQASRGGTIAGGAGGASNMTTTPSNRSPNPSREGDSNSSNNGRPNVDVGGSICTNGGNGGNAETGGDGGSTVSITSAVVIEALAGDQIFTSRSLVGRVTGSYALQAVTSGGGFMQQHGVRLGTTNNNWGLTTGVNFPGTGTYTFTMSAFQQGSVTLDNVDLKLPNGTPKNIVVTEGDHNISVSASDSSGLAKDGLRNPTFALTIVAATNITSGGETRRYVLAAGEGGVGGISRFNAGGAGARGTAGERPGGGGGGAGYCFNKGKVSAGGSGGGSGGFVSQSFATNKARLGLTNSYEGLVAGQKIVVVIGAGGNGGNGDQSGGDGGNGQVIINWT